MTEVILTTEETGELWSACVWDPTTGAPLRTYKGADAAGPRSASILGNDYLLLSDKTKPILNCWPLNDEQPVTSVMFDCMGTVNAMAVTPNGFFVVTAVGKSLMVWQIASGRQLAVVERHIQPITCIKFTDDGSHFISGGEDGQAHVWALAYVASAHTGKVHPKQTVPRYSFSDHALPIRDIHVGYGGLRGRFLTVSLDATCRMYDLSCGRLLATIIFNNPLTAVTMDPVETIILVGASNGNIFQVDVGSPLRTWEYYVKDERKGKVFVGHSKLVTCLSLSQNATVLLSGSLDHQVILWDIRSRQRIRTIEHKGSITNAFFTMAPKQMFSDFFKPVLVLNTFHKASGNLIIKVRTTEDQYKMYENLQMEAAAFDETAMQDKLMELAKKNSDMYKFSMEKVFEVLNNSTDNKTNLISKVGTTEDEHLKFEDLQMEATASDNTAMQGKYMELTKKNSDLYKFSKEEIFEVNNSTKNKTSKGEASTSGDSSKFQKKKKAQSKRK